MDLVGSYPDVLMTIQFLSREGCDM